jgi:nucleotide-binding universal stress UspA family protein
MTSQPTPNSPAPTVYVVGIDGSEYANHVLETAGGLCVALGGAAELHILHVLPLPPTVPVMGMAPLVQPMDLLGEGRMIVDRACVEAAKRYSGCIVGHIAAGEACREITLLAAALCADLVVVGTAGRTGLARLALGSVAEKVVRNAGCPVLVVRPKDHGASVAPAIEPPCPDCVAVQKDTARAQLWCQRHGEHHTHGRLHYEMPPSFALGTMLIRP